MKEKSCTGCIHISDKACGKIKAIRGSSGSITIVKVSENGCMLRKVLK